MSARPFNQLLVLVGVSCAAGALATLGSARSLWLAAAAFTAALAAGLDAVLREHLSGRCDNSPLLAGALACVLSGVGAWQRFEPVVVLIGALVAFGVAAAGLHLLFRERRRRA